VPTFSREEALALIGDGHRRLSELFALLSDADMRAPQTIGKGDWSAKDLLGHIAAWEEVALERLRAVREGEPVPPFPAGGVSRFNAEHVAAARRRSLRATRGRAERTHRALVHAIRDVDDDRWTMTVDAPGQRARVATLVGRALAGPGGQFRHAFAHLPDLERYVSALPTSRRSD
jgi:DinB superfamily